MPVNDQNEKSLLDDALEPPLEQPARAPATVSVMTAAAARRALLLTKFPFHAESLVGSAPLPDRECWPPRPMGDHAVQTGRPARWPCFPATLHEEKHRTPDPARVPGPLICSVA